MHRSVKHDQPQPKRTEKAGGGRDALSKPAVPVLSQPVNDWLPPAVSHAPIQGMFKSKPGIEQNTRPFTSSFKTTVAQRAILAVSGTTDEITCVKSDITSGGAGPRISYGDTTYTVDGYIPSNHEDDHTLTFKLTKTDTSSMATLVKSASQFKSRTVIQDEVKVASDKIEAAQKRHAERANRLINRNSILYLSSVLKHNSYDGDKASKFLADCKNSSEVENKIRDYMRTNAPDSVSSMGTITYRLGGGETIIASVALTAITVFHAGPSGGGGGSATVETP